MQIEHIQSNRTLKIQNAPCRVKDEGEEVIRRHEIRWFRCVKEDLETVYFKYGLSDPSFRKMQVAHNEQQEAAMSKHHSTCTKVLQESVQRKSKTKGSIPQCQEELYSSSNLSNE